MAPARVEQGVHSNKIPSASRSHPPGTVRLLALHAFENATALDCVQWATDALAGGWDSPALRILAGLDLGQLPSVWDATPYLERSLAELHIPLPDREWIVRQYVDDLALQIVRGRIPPREAVEIVHRVAIAPLSHPLDLQPWCDLSGGLDPHSRAPVGEAHVDEEIRAYAQEWLRGRGRDATGTV